MNSAISTVLLSLVFIASVESQLTANVESPAADALCEAQGLQAARAGNRCIVKSIGTAGNYTTITNACPPIAGLKNGRLAFPYSRAIHNVLYVDPPLIPGTYTYGRYWTALVQRSGSIEPAGGWSLQMANGSLIDIPSAAISWANSEPDDADGPGGSTAPYDYALLTNKYKDKGAWLSDPNHNHWLCEYEFVDKFPVVFNQNGAGFVLNPSLIYAQPTVDNDHQCVNECLKAYICGSLGFNSATKQCSLYWIHSEHANFAANQVPGDAYDTFWELSK